MVPAVIAGLVVIVAAACSFAAESPLGRPTQQIDQILPEAVIEDFTLPDKPLRIASRPNGPQSTTSKPVVSKPSITNKSSATPTKLDDPLDWRPGLKIASKKLSKSDLDQQKAPETEEPAALKPVTKAPVLIAPRREPAVASKSEKPESPTAKKQPTETKPQSQKKPASQAESSQKQSAPKQSTPKQQAKVDSTLPVVAEPLKPLSRSMRNLRSRMRTVLSYYYRKPFSTAENDPWEVMHGMLAYELHSRVLNGSKRNDPITAIGHLCFNRPSKRQQMLYLNEQGELDVRVGVGVQGHKGQFLAMLAQCNVSPDYPIRVEGKEFTIHDLVKSEQRSCYTQTELTFKLIGLGHYLDSDASWVNDQGETWDIPRLIREERTQQIRGAACGGTHRLAGLSLAYRRREARGEPIDGEYAEAAKFVSEYQSYAFRLQNSDGSLSTEWFRGPGKEEDIERRLRTTGHTLEWLSYSLPDDQLESHRAVRAASYLTNLLATNANQEWHLGSLAHALHALVIYDKRVFQPHDKAENQGIAGADRIDPTSNLYRNYSIYRGVMRNSAPESNFFGLFGGSGQSRRPTGYRNN